MRCAYVLISLIALSCVILSCVAIILKYKSTKTSHQCVTPDRLSGICVPIHQCKNIVNFKPNNTQEKEALKLYSCESGVAEESVCCSNQAINLDWIYEDCETPDQTIGKCKPISSCKYIIEHPNRVELVEFALREYTCENKGTHFKNPMVCCPPKPMDEIKTRIAPTDPAPMDHSKHENVHLLPMDNCGYSGTTKIASRIRAEVKLSEFPWIVAIQFQSGVFGCGGSLINNRYILTAAHCIRHENKEIIGVRLGEYDFSKEKDCDQDEDCTTYQDFNVSSNDVIVHPEYNNVSFENDIALIRLREEPNTANFSVAPICLPITTAEKTHHIQTYTVIGWGQTLFSFSSKILMRTDLPAQDYSRCSNNSLGSKQICAGGVYEEGTCMGDSGGPLMAAYTENVKYKIVQYGVISRGRWECGVEDVPTFHTKVSAYMGWILDTLKP